MSVVWMHVSGTKKTKQKCHDARRCLAEPHRQSSSIVERKQTITLLVVALASTHTWSIRRLGVIRFLKDYDNNCAIPSSADHAIFPSLCHESAWSNMVLCRLDQLPVIGFWFGLSGGASCRFWRQSGTLLCEHQNQQFVHFYNGAPAPFVSSFFYLLLHWTNSGVWFPLW